MIIISRISLASDMKESKVKYFSAHLLFYLRNLRRTQVILLMARTTIKLLSMTMDLVKLTLVSVPRSFKRAKDYFLRTASLSPSHYDSGILSKTGNDMPTTL